MTQASQTVAGTQANTALLSRNRTSKRNYSDMIVQAARDGNVSPLRQFREIALLKSRRNGFTPKEYYDMQIYRSDLSWAQKREFVGEMGSYRLNLRLAPPEITQMRGFLSDKLALTSVLTQFGLPTTTTQAVFATDRNLGKIRTLRNEADIVGFITNEARFPLFGKPVTSFQAIGTIGITSVVAGEGVAHLTSGRSTSVAALATEIVAHHPDGFMFQDAVQQHPKVTELVGPAVGTCRVVTVMNDGHPRVLYAVWKVPSPGAMADNFWQSGSMLALPDIATGEVIKCRRGAGPSTEWIETHPISGLPICGFVLPKWQSVIDTALAAHGIFPINGILGWDIAIGPDGGRVIECNENTCHTLYQCASGRGVLNADFLPAFAKVDAHNDATKQKFRNFNRAVQATLP
ncbi:hypothetical protein GALL_428120 [mine drainage metagenome]|uniref:Alpha-L-glutamate ligase-related protein ATP-grasp domain-containing protein n=1 Tax=mine drainage metagenome TaxID=410659 RepID=A0A1J5QHP9_9ZZZZ